MKLAWKLGVGTFQERIKRRNYPTKFPRKFQIKCPPGKLSGTVTVFLQRAGSALLVLGYLPTIGRRTFIGRSSIF